MAVQRLDVRVAGEGGAPGTASGNGGSSEYPGTAGDAGLPGKDGRTSA